MKKHSCPICGKPPVVEFRPFCSRRCADVDLNRWLGGTYRMPTEERPDPGDSTPYDDEDDTA